MVNGRITHTLSSDRAKDEIYAGLLPQVEAVISWKAPAPYA
jgi:hypothetical protein